MGVSKNSGFSPQIINSNRVFPYKPSILGYPYFCKHPHIDGQIGCFCSILDDPNRMTKCEKVVLFHQKSKSYNVLRTPLLRTGSHISAYTTSWSYGWHAVHRMWLADLADLWYVMFSIGISKEATDLEWQNFRPGSVQCHHGRLPSRATWQAHRNADTIHYTYCFTYIYIWYDMYIYRLFLWSVYLYTNSTDIYKYVFIQQ